jgi:hypothetical protein
VNWFLPCAAAATPLTARLVPAWRNPVACRVVKAQRGYETTNVLARRRETATRWQ